MVKHPISRISTFTLVLGATMSTSRRTGFHRQAAKAAEWKAAFLTSATQRCRYVPKI